jgi:ribosomal protein S3
MIPAGKAGLVIGKGGETIKQLQVTGSSIIPIKFLPISA